MYTYIYTHSAYILYYILLCQNFPGPRVSANSTYVETFGSTVPMPVGHYEGFVRILCGCDKVLHRGEYRQTFRSVDEGRCFCAQSRFLNLQGSWGFRARVVWFGAVGLSASSFRSLRVTAWGYRLCAKAVSPVRSRAAKLPKLHKRFHQAVEKLTKQKSFTLTRQLQTLGASS